MVQNSDQKLVSDYFHGDKAAFEQLVRQYLKPVYNFTWRIIGDGVASEDVVQEVFFKIWKNIKRFDLNKSFKTWIFQITKNTCIDYLRKKKETPFSYFEDEEGGNALAETVVDPSPLPDELFYRSDLATHANSAIQELAPVYRLVMFLKYNDHFNFQEISEILGESLNTVKSRHRRALIKLKKMLT